MIGHNIGIAIRRILNPPPCIKLMINGRSVTFEIHKKYLELENALITLLIKFALSLCNAGKTASRQLSIRNSANNLWLVFVPNHTFRVQTALFNFQLFELDFHMANQMGPLRHEIAKNKKEMD